jgi:hypothetical protein
MLLLLLSFGCGQRGELSRKVLFGEIRCGGQPVEWGIISFVPIEDTPGPTTAARINAGRYRADNRGGVPLI